MAQGFDFGDKAECTAKNAVSLRGEVMGGYAFSHEVYGEGFYAFTIKTPRLSDAYDVLPVTISERLLGEESGRPQIGDTVFVNGQIRSYNHYSGEEGRNKLILTVFAGEFGAAAEGDGRKPNDCVLDGYICKPPIYRTTPFGREIGDMLVAVNRSYNKSDYIPCITWGRNAKFCAGLSVGDRLRICGRIQSRLYQKKLADGTVLDKTAYEVSVGKLTISAE